MPAKNTNSKQTTKTVAAAPTPVAETTPAQKGGKKVATKVEAAATTPVVEAAAAPVVTKTQKGGKKVAAVETPVAPVVETSVAPVVTKTQKGGKKVAAAETPVAPVVETSAAPVVTKTQKGGKKVAAAETPVAETVAAPVVAKTGGAKKVAAKKVVEKETEDAEETGDRKIRSFKVRLPGNEEFEGRFTGLTPYQAANKALSKYFRETAKPQAEITFSIVESTRKSRKATYTYVGRRQKLDIPVTYKIQDGREIVKNFKNSLKKVKKSESVTESA
jgi:hypothetical protein